MSVDDRLRASLARDRAYRPEHQERALAEITARAQQRRRLRGFVIGAVAAVVLIIAAVAVPWALSESRSSNPIVVTPTTPAPIDDWRPPDRTTPVDGGPWRTMIQTRSARRAALTGTGLERYGGQVFSQADLAEAHSEAEFLQGSFSGLVQSHINGTLAVVPPGTFRVDGPELTVAHTDGGRTVFRWRMSEANRLTLRFVRTTLPPMYGAPAEVFLRMWAAAPFTLS